VTTTAAPTAAERATPTSAVALPAASPAQDDWASIVAALALQGPTGQLAAHCTLVSLSGEVIRLQLDAANAHFRRAQIEEKLGQALSRHFGRTLRLEISEGEAGVMTPARHQAQAVDERLRAAEQAIETDPAVRAMRDVFGATVKPGSVRPLN
jgi:DNA polymerase-3 subunit gamma/tau